MAAEQGELQEQLAGGLEQNDAQHGITGPDEIGDAQAVPSLLVCLMPESACAVWCVSILNCNPTKALTVLSQRS